jgi:environmental stress-induced protein Ves
MREVLHRSASDSRRMPWKNGRGVTEELAIWPDSARFDRGDFEWRIAKARVDESGPFSTFPGCERILVVLDGAGLVLAHGSSAPRARVRPLEPYRFDGEWPTTAELVSGPVTDCGLLVRRGRAADVEVARLRARRARETVGPGHAFLHALAGSVTVRIPREEDPFELAPGESVWLRGLAEEEELDLAGGHAESLALIVRVGAPARNG